MESRLWFIKGGYFDFIALINFSFRLSALAFWSDITAQMAAGIHPINVIWSMKQINAVKILPRKKKESAGKKMAISVIEKIVQ